MKDWLCVGRVEEVAKPGDYMTMRIAGEPVVITRASDNNLHALYNMCAHRGVEVAHGRGNARVFNCPYHGWTYDLEGKLKGAAYMKESEGFDLSACRLQPIRIDVWRGSIFICFSAETEPFEEFIRPFEDDFAFLHPEGSRNCVDFLRGPTHCQGRALLERFGRVAGDPHPHRMVTYAADRQYGVAVVYYRVDGQLHRREIVPWAGNPHPLWTHEKVYHRARRQVGIHQPN